MKALLLLLLLVAPAWAQFYAPGYAAPFTQDASEWVEVTRMHFPRTNPCGCTGPYRGFYIAAVQHGSPGQTAGIPPRTWTLVDLTRVGVSPNAKAAFIHAHLIMTHGTAPDMAWGSLAFRRPGSLIDNSGNYHTQVAEPLVGSGVRTMDGLWAPVENGLIEVYWSPHRTVAADYPTGTTIAMNLIVNGWGE